MKGGMQGDMKDEMKDGEKGGEKEQRTCQACMSEVPSTLKESQRCPLLYSGPALYSKGESEETSTQRCPLL
jgi:hypothetical protein